VSYYYANDVPEELVDLFESITFRDQDFMDFEFDITELKYKFSSANAKFKFFGFARIICGYLYSSEKYKLTDEYHNRYFNKLFDELINFWIYPAFISNFKLISSDESFINSSFKKCLQEFRASFKEILLIQLHHSNQISIVRLYKHWIKNADKYYVSLLTDSIKVLDSN